MEFNYLVEKARRKNSSVDEIGVNPLRKAQGYMQN